jgi:cell fate (sporulation/competence/biofilm development) regulator YlbF (YheA/YmcA/DUF963 family)
MSSIEKYQKYQDSKEIYNNPAFACSKCKHKISENNNGRSKIQFLEHKIYKMNKKINELDEKNNNLIQLLDDISKSLFEPELEMIPNYLHVLSLIERNNLITKKEVNEEVNKEKIIVCGISLFT